MVLLRSKWGQAGHLLPLCGAQYGTPTTIQSKRFSFYQRGMLPVTFSLTSHRRTGNGWSRRGHSISYSSSPVLELGPEKKSSYYGLSWEMRFDWEDDYVMVSSGLPYSYTRLIQQVRSVQEKCKTSGVTFSMGSVAHSLSNNQVPYLTLTKDHEHTLENVEVGLDKPAQVRAKPVVFVMARQHPGETHSSFLMGEMLNELASGSTLSRTLLEHYEFHLVPMVNVDGVIYGNFRCDLAGFDLNRVWKHPIRELHPQVFAIKEQLAGLRATGRPIAACLDLHSHSKLANVFSYCCKTDEVESRLFSYMLSRRDPLFHFPSCTFGLSRDKLTTGRAVLFHTARHHHVITIEISAMGGQKGREISPMQPSDLALLAQNILQTQYDYQFSTDILQSFRR